MKSVHLQKQEMFLDAKLEDLVPPITLCSNAGDSGESAAEAGRDLRRDPEMRGGRRSLRNGCCGLELRMRLSAVHRGRMLVEPLRYNLLFRWFMGLE